MEYWRSGTVAGLVRRAGVCVCGTIGANGKNAESGAAEEFTISGAGGQNHRTTTQRVAADQRHAKDDRDAAAVWRFRMLSDDVSAGVSEWRRFLSLRAAAQGGRELAAGWVAEEDFCAREESIWGYPAVPGGLLLVRERAVTLLRE